jgi:hypothetical protein
VATTPHDETAVRSYPDDPHPGTTRKTKPGDTQNPDRRQCEIPIRLIRVDTIPMTPDEFDNATEALAVLLNQYWQAHPDLAV